MKNLLTNHARVRMNARGISKYAVELAISICRPMYSKGAEFYFIGKKLVKKFIDVIPDIEKYEGVVVIINSKGNSVILTTYKNKNFTKKFRGYHV